MKHAKWFVAAVLTLAAAAGAQDLAPASLLVYYGWPSSINATFSISGAAAELGAYDHIVLGDGLEKASHPDHANTVAILAHPDMARTTVFGYIDLGVSTQNLSLAEIGLRVTEWASSGADGIFFDDFGYDFGVDRARQNSAVDAAHAAGLPVVANAFRVADAFDDDIDPVSNPTGDATHLGAGDFYLYESHQVRLNAYVAEVTWQDKASEVDALRVIHSFGVLSITTTDVDDPAAFEQAKFDYAWFSALLYGHVATGWGEYAFSASGASNAQAPYRVRPSVTPGASFTSPVVASSPVYTRGTDTGTIQVDAAAHVGSFLAYWPDLGGGTSGIAGPPTLVGCGTLVGGTPASVTLTNAPPAGLMLAWIAFAPTPFMAIGGTVHAFPFASQLILFANGVGEFTGATTWPTGIPPGTEVWFQFVLEDTSVSYGITLSNGVMVTTP